jgi:hypothetical protein
MAAPAFRASFRSLTITLLVAGGVYAWYALTQYDRLNDLHQRQLSKAAAELKTSLDDSLEIVRRFNDKWKVVRAEKDKAKPARGKAAAARSATAADSDLPRVCDFVRSQSYLDLRECGVLPSDDVGWEAFTEAQWTSTSALSLDLRAGSKIVKSFAYRIESLLHELAFPDSFTLLLVATEQGDVLYQDAPVQHRWLRYLRWGERAFRDAHAEMPPSLQIQNLQEIVGGEAAWKKLRTVSSRTSIELGGNVTQLYLQPLVLHSAQPITLVVGGAVPRSSVIRDSLALGPSLLGILVFLVLLGVLGFPFVKLACLDRHERFCLRDIKLVYVSAGALLVLFTCASLALDGYSRWRMEADGGLAPLAAHLEEGLVDELEAIRAALGSYDAQVTGSNWPCEKPVEANWLKEERRPKKERRDGLPWPADVKLRDVNLRDVNLRTVAWVEPGGQQVWKSTADPIPGKIRVAHRAYFRAVREDNLFTAKGSGPAFFFAPDRSISDAKFYTFVSMPSAVSPERCAKHPGTTAGAWVAVAEAQLLSLDSQPLPAGYGFAVINREGRVLYHSDGRLSLRENLYDELSDGERVRAMVYAGSTGGLDTRYRERPHRFYLQPIRLARAATDAPAAGDWRADDRNAGFYMAGFRDTSVEQALLAHVFVVGLGGPMALLFLFWGAGLGLLVLAARFRQHHWSVWLWPHRGLERIYQWQTAAFLFVLLVSVGVHLATDSVTPFLVAPFAAVALGVVIYRSLAASAGPRASLCSRWQRLSVFLVLVCLIVVPSAALFRVAVSQEFAKLIMTETEWVRAQAEDRPRAAAVTERADQISPDRTKQLRLAREGFVSCLPAPFDAPSRLQPVEPPASRRAEAVPAAFATVKPAAAVPGELLVTCSKDASAPSATLQPIGVVVAMLELLHLVDEFLPIDNDMLVRQHFHEVGQTYSPDGTIVRRFRAAGISLLGFALALGLLYWWISWNTNQVFLADLDAGPPPAGNCEQVWSQCTPEEQMVLIQIAREHIANPYLRDTVKGLLGKGLLQLAPDVQPYSAEFAALVRKQERTLEAKIQEWQDVNATRSWRRWRLILGASVGVVGFFLIATQPGLQSSVIAVATGTTGVLTAGSKLREAVTAWLERKKA